MKTRTTVAVLILSLMLICGGLGCVAASKLITPAKVEPRVVQYVKAAGIAEPNDYSGWWANLDAAERLDGDLEMAHGSIQLALEQKMETDNTTYAFLKDISVRNVDNGRGMEEFLFSEGGLLSTGLSMVGAGGLMGFLGLMRKRPQDWTPEDVQAAIASAEAKSEAVVVSKDQQLTELVTRVQKFLSEQKIGGEDNLIAVTLKGILSEKQSPELRETVAKVKANIV